MHIREFYHICRAAAAIANVEYITVFGSNAILPWLKEVGIEDTKRFLESSYVSIELDLCAGDGKDERLNTLIDASIGELSSFQNTFNVYAHANPIEGLFLAPKSWPKRVKIEREPQSHTRIIVPHYIDLMVSKIVAGRPKDMEFARRTFELFSVKMNDLNMLVEKYLAENPDRELQVQQNLMVFKEAVLEGYQDSELSP